MISSRFVRKLSKLGLLCYGSAAAVSLSLAQVVPPKPETMDDSTFVLDPFLVTSSVNEGYFAKSATASGRIAQRLEDIPQSIDVFNAKFIEDTMPGTLHDVLHHSAAVQFSNHDRNTNGGFVRGFDFNVSLRNGERIEAFAPAGGMEAIEQVEVVKGAASVLYGPGQPGGVINYITKRPQFTASASAQLRTYSFGGYTASIDSTGPLGPKDRDGKNKLAYRLVLASEDRGGYQVNDERSKRQLIYGAVTWRPLSTLTFDVELEDSVQKVGFFNSILLAPSEYNPPIAGGTATAKPYQQVVLPYNMLPVEFTYQDSGTHRHDYASFAQVSMLWRNDFGRFGAWALRAYYSLRDYSADRVLFSNAQPAYLPQPVTTADIGRVVNYTEAVTAADVAAGRLWIPGRFARRLYDRKSDTGRTQWDLTGKFTTGPVNHTFLLGTDTDLGLRTRVPVGERLNFERQVDHSVADQRLHAIWVDNPNPRNVTATINWDDIRSASNPTGAVTNQVFTGPVYENSLRFKVPFLTSPVNNYYLFDALSFWNDRINLSLGARHDKLFQTVGPTVYSAERWTYRYGVVAKLKPWLHLYALHNESFLPNSSAAAVDFNSFIAPQQGKHEEVGIRLPLWHDRLLIELARYRITNTNVVQLDPFFTVGGNNTDPRARWKFIDGQENNGYDLNVKVGLTKDSQLMFSYAHYDMYYFGNPAQIAAGITKFRAVNIPPDQFTLWGTWAPQAGPAKNFNLSLGYRYVSKRPGGGVGGLPSMELNAYGIADVGVGYQWKRWKFNLLVHNALDEYAYRTAAGPGLVYPERPREAILGVSTKF